MIDLRSYQRTLLALAEGGLITRERAAHQLGDARLHDEWLPRSAEALNSYERDRSSTKPPRSARPRRSLRRGGD